MIQANIFRALPSLRKVGNGADGVAEDDDIVIDPSWPHMQPVYEIFLQIVLNESEETKQLKNFVNHKFIQEFMELLDSEEPKEREYLKNILHRIYAKLVPRRKLIRKGISDILNSLVTERVKMNGTAELLDILAAIISGFAVPLREEHHDFFQKTIIPLHKVQTSQQYHSELLRCSMLFVSKDPNLSYPLIKGLLRYWPFANYFKETKFLQELLEVLDVCEPSKLEPILEILFKRLVRCICSPHLQVSDTAMCFFENEFFLSIVKLYKSRVFPILVPSICYLADNHWHKLLQDSLLALRNILRDMDANLFDKSSNSKDTYTTQFGNEACRKKREVADKKWQSLAAQAFKANPDMILPVVPYTDSHIVGHHNGMMNMDPLVIESR